MIKKIACVYVCLCVNLYYIGPNVPTRIVKCEMVYIVRTNQWSPGGKLINEHNLCFLENVKEQNVFCNG